MVKKIHKDAQTAIHYLEGRSLIGEINRPSVSAEKKPRKKRTPKVKIKEVWSPGKESVPSNPPEDKNIFYNAKTVIKRSRKKALYSPTDEGEAT